MLDLHRTFRKTEEEEAEKEEGRGVGEEEEEITTFSHLDMRSIYMPTSSTEKFPLLHILAQHLAA